MSCRIEIARYKQGGVAGEELQGRSCRGGDTGKEKEGGGGVGELLPSLPRSDDQSVFLVSSKTGA